MSITKIQLVVQTYIVVIALCKLNIIEFIRELSILYWYHIKYISHKTCRICTNLLFKKYDCDLNLYRNMGSKDKENMETAPSKNESNGKLVLPENMIWG